MGEPIVGRRVERVFKTHLAKAGLPTTLHPHSLRHSTATYLLAAGVPDRVVMNILGHSNLTMTSHHQHVLSTMLTDAADALERVMSR